MRKSILYYCAFFYTPLYKLNEPYSNRDVAYVIAQYSDGSNRCWYPEDKGFKSAKYKALHRDTR